MCHLCTGRQADYVPDPWTEARKAQVIAELREAERAMGLRPEPVIVTLPTTTACTEVWSATP